jgi:hypothetical protein
MRKIEMLLLEREDLIESLTDVDFIMIDNNSFGSDIKKQIIKHNIVMFINNHMKTKILKNRFGYRGEVN